MNISRLCFNIILLQGICIFGAFAQPPNTLTSQEKALGWSLLFDGKTFNGWKKIAEGGWEIKNGELLAVKPENGKQMDIITNAQFDNFELFFEFKISKETNSGVKYLVTNDYEAQKGTFLGLEYQILDEMNFKYPERGEIRSLASLYDLISADKKNPALLEHWNIARIIVNKNHIQHWLNGRKVVDYDRSTESFKSLIEKSKYKSLKNFGQSKKGHILLQNEGSPIAFRSIKIKWL
ncbi:DUF1080 domain-containing protein [Pedobacter panaciterrae]|uniref:3-keto-disaccharide hydrolase n=1 Tax=Pedobacter panaciterrae TaxID=363849 RepID=UPI00155D8B3C|nr:DUF1080 domain-containing protein [Pedobacter panaciterrae]NQX57213.1 DUF1080 domain-containing protein [Pedobacter panaciterrae]